MALRAHAHPQTMTAHLCAHTTRTMHTPPGGVMVTAVAVTTVCKRKPSGRAQPGMGHTAAHAAGQHFWGGAASAKHRQADTGTTLVSHGAVCTPAAPNNHEVKMSPAPMPAHPRRQHNGQRPTPHTGHPSHGQRRHMEAAAARARLAQTGRDRHPGAHAWEMCVGGAGSGEHRHMVAAASQCRQTQRQQASHPSLPPPPSRGPANPAPEPSGSSGISSWWGRRAGDPKTEARGVLHGGAGAGARGRSPHSSNKGPSSRMLAWPRHREMGAGDWQPNHPAGASQICRQTLRQQWVAPAGITRQHSSHPNTGRVANRPASRSPRHGAGP